MKVLLNCDMGESFGLYSFGNDAALMPHIDQANVACGYHASDPNHMAKTVSLAAEHGVAVGAHVSLPDLPGFGRREMKIERDELRNIILYQIGALSAFCKEAGCEVSHIKPHGALYGMASRQEHVAEAVADTSRLYGLPVMGLAGTLHETVYTANGAGFLAEFFADLDYSDEGTLLITREHAAIDPALVAARAVQAARDATLTTQGGKTLPVQVETICIHSDTPNSEAIAAAVSEALTQLDAA
ncbi:MAG: 5-oxoprolinase subunit PxpA [Pseudomonadota bacterium]